MAIYKRKETWWIEFTDSNGNRIQQSAKTKNKQEAQELHDRLKSDSWRVKQLGAKERHTWQEAVVRWLTEQEHKKSLNTDKSRLVWLDQYLHNVYLDEISKSKVDTIKRAKKSEGASNATVNRVLALLRSILNRAQKEWEWLESTPSIRLFSEPTGRISWLSHDEHIRLIKELPQHLADMARFTLATGLRESNVTGLQWSQIDMLRKCAWIYADQTKNNKSIAVPLNCEAISILKAQIGKHETNVFTYEGLPVTVKEQKIRRDSNLSDF